MARFQILAFDGGGIRGAFGIGFLQELEMLTGRKFRDSFDLIAGTSTGAITAMGLGIGHGGQELVEFYQRFADKIFTPQPPYDPDSMVLSSIYSMVHKVIESTGEMDIDHFFRPRYSSESLRECLVEGFYDLQLKDIAGPRVIVPSINLTAGKPHVFGTPHLPNHLKDANLSIVDVLMATTAAPTYFKQHNMPDGNAYVDGGLWASSPGMLALAEALRLRQLCGGDQCVMPFSTNEIFLLNIGTGTVKFSLDPGETGGSLFWAQHVTDVMISSQVQGTELPLKYLLSDRVKSINFELPDDSWRLDAVGHLGDLLEMGRQAAREHMDEIESLFMQHSPQPYAAVDDLAHDDPSITSAL